MRFWDSSAIVPLLVNEASSAEMTVMLQADPEMVVWWGTTVECHSAFRRLEAQGILSADDVEHGVTQLRILEDSWIEVQPTEKLKTRALRALSVHGLRAADSFQLAAALSWSPVPSEGDSFVCLDQRLARAAGREGFGVIG